MPHIPVLKAKELLKILKKQGFLLDRVKGSHHIMIHKEKQLSVSVPFHKGKTLGKGITHAILKDAGIPVDQVKKK
jgi:predicted RNA binding protein YcfA (HicA-like mRNA interferase family)